MLRFQKLTLRSIVSAELKDVYSNTMKFFKDGADLSNIQPNVLEWIGSNSNCLRITFPVKMSPDPKQKKQPTKVFIGYRAQQSLHFLPTMGGTMIAPDINTEKIMAHATINTIQAAVLNIPVGGAKGGIRADPKSLTQEELQNLIRRYAKEIITRGYCNPAFDVLGPGYGVSTQEGQKDVHYAACVVGKDEENHGLEGFKEATGRGFYILANNALQDKFFLQRNPKLTEGLKDKTFIITGFSFRGYEAAKWLVNEGKAVCVGIYDQEDGIFNQKGLDIVKAYEFVQKRQSFKDFPDVEYVSEFNSLISKECDILIPAQGTLSLTSKNSALVNCKMIVEGTDAAISYDSSQILASKNIPVIPDVLATGGGMIISYFEWLQNLSHQKWGQMTKQVFYYSVGTIIKLGVCKINSRRNIQNQSDKELYSKRSFIIRSSKKRI